MTGRRNNVHIALVTTPEAFLQILAVRAICYMEEHGVPFRQTMDGNDYQATHLICTIDGEPVGTARMRWFSDFVKIERTSIRPAFRSPRLTVACANFMFDHIARKGFRRVITHAKPTYARLWTMLLGFKRSDKPPLHFIGHDEPYFELIKQLDAHPEPITIDADTATLFRIEGEWDVRGEFEATASL